MKFEDRSQQETRRQERFARGKAGESSQKYFTSSEKKTKLQSIRIPMSGLCRPHPPLNRKKESLWQIPEQVCIWSAERPEICIGDHEDIEVSHDGDDGQRRGANKRRSNGKVLRLYDMEIHQKISRTMVKRSTDQKHRIRKFDAWNERIETGTLVKNRKGIIGVEGGKGIGYQWKEKGECSQGDRCSFRHESNDRAQKPERNDATPSESSFHEVEVCRRKEVSNAKVTMVPFSNNRAEHI